MAHSRSERPAAGDSVLICTAANERYALPLAHVREVLLRPALAAPVAAPPWCTGVLRLRGDVLPVFDLRLLLGLPPAEPRLSDRVVIVESESIRLGLVVDAVAGVEAIPALPPGTGVSATGVVSAVYDGGEGVVSVLAIDALLQGSTDGNWHDLALGPAPEEPGVRLIPASPRDRP